MTHKQLQEEITRLKTTLAELEEKVKLLPNEDGGVFKPEVGQEYWFISGYAECGDDLWEGHSFDNDRYSIGNCFPTEQSVIDFVRALKLIQKARESQNGFVPDWEDDAQTKYFLNFHMGDIGITDYYSVNIAPIFGFWEDELVCEQFVQDNHDELLWYFEEYNR